MVGLPKNGALAGASINILTMLLLIGFFGYQLVVLPEVIEKLDRGYEKIIQTQEISNKTGTKIITQLFYLLNRGTNNTERIYNLTVSLPSIENNLLGNLTNHRIIANMTRDNTLGNISELKDMLIDMKNLLNSTR
jgi:hypothetical protein